MLIPSSSLIFALCRDGNIDAARLMLKRGDASLRDISEYGETLIHAAASFCHDDMCKFLLLGGADPSVVEDMDALHTHWDYPFEMMVRRIKNRTEINSELDDTETGRQIAWDEAFHYYEDGVCYYCFRTKNL
ncbi:hypothetical protein IFR05_012651, partial [Cadophora sp. M221]